MLFIVLVLEIANETTNLSDFENNVLFVDKNIENVSITKDDSKLEDNNNLSVAYTGLDC
ncbi:hypothetical protein [Methanobrevibacter oralis]|uniref:Uncharacterized protein n=1 Tax=Methanobrevibacter oralis TaxID=66851 RepID=A0A166CCU4_METOA|nr:hypothetical protein [Methanobrevibacter oralis]KZX13237.1 hypothetical protein MBORA_07870 [Methanobrevibacter oralis]